jgi:hypothetical protein
VFVDNRFFIAGGTWWWGVPVGGGIPVGALALDLRLKGRGYQASGSRLSTGPLVICDVADT